MTAANLIKETFSILNRFSGAVQFTTEIEYEPGALPSIKLGLAVRIGVKSGADLSGANLSGADLSGANLSGVDLSGVDLSGVDLSDADLSGANLSGADLYRADLSDADLSGANLYRADLYRADLSGQKIVRWIAEAKRSDGYSFVALLTESSGLKIKAGCRWFSLNEFRAHVADEYPGTDKAAETLDILNFIEARNAFIASQKEAA